MATEVPEVLKVLGAPEATKVLGAPETIKAPEVPQLTGPPTRGAHVTSLSRGETGGVRIVSGGLKRRGASPISGERVSRCLGLSRREESRQLGI